MESIGLMPSSTGEPGGKKTGQKMGDYPIKNGAFYLQCVAFSQMGYQLPFYDRYAKIESSQARLSSQLAETATEALYSAIQASYQPEQGQSVSVVVESADTVEQGDDSGAAELAAPPADEATLQTYAAAEASLMQPFSDQFDIDLSELTESREKEAAAKRKTAYLCQSCGDKAWGKPTLDLWCGKCQIAFVKLDDAAATMLMEGKDE